MKRAVLDSSALLTFFLNRPGAEKVEVIMGAAMAGGRKIYLSVVNWGEIHYTIWRGGGAQAATQIELEISRMPIEIVNADIELTRIAASFRAHYKLAYADCFVAALAKRTGAEIVTADQDFSIIEKEVDVSFV